MFYPDLKSQSPIFLGIGEKDEEVSSSQQLRLAQDACAAGTVVEAHLYRDAMHGPAVNGSFKDSLPFAHKVLGNEPIQAVCRPLPQ